VLIVSVNMIVAVALSGERLSGQLHRLTASQLAREARLIALQWRSGVNPDALADSAGAQLGHRVTLVDSSGKVLGDSEFDGPSLDALQNHNNRPEIIQARAEGTGSSRRISPSEGDEELYVAVRAADGRIARVSISTAQLEEIASRAQRDVLFSGLVALVIAIGLAVVFSRQVSKPVSELRDVAGAIAAGDLSRRPALSAPGEIGELATAVQRMAEQVDSRTRALQTEDQLLGALVESLNEGVLAVDRHRQVIRINRSGRQLLDAQAPVPFSVDMLPRDRTLHDALAEALGGGIVDRVETQIGSRTLALTARPLSAEGGGAVLALFDLTGTRRLEAVRRDFVANVSHELKTPLTAIRGFAETLSTELASHQQHAQFAETIRQNAERMQRLIDDLLDLSRIESGGWTPSPTEVDVAAVAAEAAAAYRDEANRRGNDIRISVDANAAKLRADPVALRQALGNLVENAVRYTPTGGTITIFARSEDHGVAIGVSDTGTGIPAEHLPRIFERFYRVDAARSRAGGGTGLGLAIVKHLVEAHGGRVRAESRVGHGTTVILFFPR
jgi:signal transduction histidine kinase